MTSQHFSHAILMWFDRYGRNHLPWQQHITPYRVWISEIMLQQTQVSTVIPYFERFTQKFPDIAALAKAHEDEVLHLWTGLGYYSRARNLHKSAKIILSNHGSKFPDTFETLRNLPGIGRSTAGAILSIAFNKPTPILDGNVKRVLTRFCAIEDWPSDTKTSKQLWEIAEQYTPKKRVADYTQAIMDLGATVCTRTKPKCTLCPLELDCQAHKQHRETDFPKKKPKKALLTRQIYMLILYNRQGEVFLEKRPPVGIWGGLWSFPECSPDLDINNWCQSTLGYKLKNLMPWPQFRHTFSHFHLDIKPVLAQIQEEMHNIMNADQFVWYNTHQRDVRGLAAPVKRLIDKLITVIPGNISEQTRET